MDDKIENYIKVEIKYCGESVSKMIKIKPEGDFTKKSGLLYEAWKMFKYEFEKMLIDLITALGEKIGEKK